VLEIKWKLAILGLLLLALATSACCQGEVPYLEESLYLEAWEVRGVTVRAEPGGVSVMVEPGSKLEGYFVVTGGDETVSFSIDAWGENFQETIYSVSNVSGRHDF